MKRHQNSASQISFSFLLCCLIFIQTSNCATTSPSWKGTNFIQAGSMTIVLNAVHQSLSNVYTYTYAPAFASTPFTALGLIGFQSTSLYEPKLRFLINIPNFTSTTSLQIRMNILTTSWRQFRASYIAIDIRFSQLRVDYFSNSNLPAVSNGTGLRTASGVFTLNIPAVNLAHKISIIPLLIGIQSHAVNGQHIFYFTTSLRAANSINYNITADRTTRIFNLVSYILVVDKTNAEAGYQIFMDQLYIGGANNSPSFQAPVYYNLTNMHAGLNSVKFILPAYNFDKANFQLSTLGFYQALNISVWSYRQRSCPLPQPYYQLNSNLCYDTCPTNYTNADGTTLKYCKACSQAINACQACTSIYSCTQCVGNFVVNDGGCICPQGFYVSNAYTQYQNKCRPCHTDCVTCVDGTQYNCTRCIQGRTLNNSMCFCPNGISSNGDCLISNCNDQACVQCSNDTSFCQVCAENFTLSGARCTCGVKKFYNLISITCQTCHYSCKYCSGPLSTQCTACNRDTQFRYLSINKQCLCIQGYYQSSSSCVLNTNSSCLEPGYMTDHQSGLCVEICGDGNKKVLPCDDGNTLDGDGCSNKCQIQSGFICIENILAPNLRSFCSYTQAITLTMTSMTKDIYSNILYMNFTFQPSFNYVLQYYPDLLSKIAFNTTNLTPIQAFFSNSTSILTITSQYNSSIQQSPIILQFNMPQTGLTYAIPTSFSHIMIKPNNSLAAFALDQNTYSSIKIYKIISMICYIGGLVACIICGFFRKMIGLDYIVMLQLSYFAIMLSEYHHAYLGPLQEWDFVNGYNQMRTGISTAVLAQNKFWTLGYVDYYYSNCNAMIFACLANYLIALILYGLSMLSDKSVSRKLKVSAIFFAVDIGFTLFMLSFNNIVVSLFLQAQAGHILNFSYGLNKFMVILSILMFIGQMAGYFMKVHEVTDSLLFYHRNKNYCHFYPFIFVIRNLVLILFIVLAQKMPTVSPYICLGIEAAYIIAVLAGRPYKRYIDYFRMCAVQLPFLLLLSCHLIQANFIQDFGNIDSGTFNFLQIGAIVVIAGMLFGLIMTWTSFAYHLWKARSNAEINPEVKPQQELQIRNIHKHSQQFDKSQQKFKLSEKEHSKQVIVFDMQEQEQGNNQNQTGAGGTIYLGQSALLDQSSKRKLKAQKKMKGKSSQFY